MYVVVECNAVHKKQDREREREREREKALGMKWK
jgi:hypothetical protein